MTELEQALLALGQELEYPVTPNLRRAVRERLERRVRTRRWLALALAVAAVGVGMAMAVPDARSSILRFFGICAVKIERVDTPPKSRERPLTAGLGAPGRRAEAERVAGLSIRLA